MGAKQERDRKMGSNIFCRGILIFMPLSFQEISMEHSLTMFVCVLHFFSVTKICLVEQIESLEFRIRNETIC